MLVGRLIRLNGSPPKGICISRVINCSCSFWKPFMCEIKYIIYMYCVCIHFFYIYIYYKLNCCKSYIGATYLWCLIKLTNIGNIFFYGLFSFKTISSHLQWVSLDFVSSKQAIFLCLKRMLEPENVIYLSSIKENSFFISRKRCKQSAKIHPNLMNFPTEILQPFAVIRQTN